MRKSNTRVHRAAVDGCSGAFLGKPASEGEDSGDCTTLSEQPAMRGRRRASDRSEASKEGGSQTFGGEAAESKRSEHFCGKAGVGRWVRERGESWSAARRPVSCTQITCIVAHSCTQIRWTLQCKACTRLHIDPFHIKLQTVARCKTRQLDFVTNRVSNRLG